MCRPDAGRLSLATQHLTVSVAFLLLFSAQSLVVALLRGVWFLWCVEYFSPAAMSGFNLLHLITKSQPVALRSCSLPSGTCRTKKLWPVSFSQEELKKRLTPMQYHVTQEKGTESAFTGEFTHHKDEGTYTCVVCGALLFSSDTKFDSGSGWPSFFDLVKEESITRTDDFSYGMHRVETTCSQVSQYHISPNVDFQDPVKRLSPVLYSTFIRWLSFLSDDYSRLSQHTFGKRWSSLWTGRQSNTSVELIWDTCLMMDQDPQENATALTLPR